MALLRIKLTGDRLLEKLREMTRNVTKLTGDSSRALENTTGYKK